ncbi:MAG: hemerythrin family protein [Sideroxyarcus sp.]
MSSSTKSSPWRLEWDEGLSVFIPEIDAEHRQFIRLVNELNEAIGGRMDVQIIKQRMQAILDDAVKHFTHEEALFREWGYPEAEQHALRHAQVLHALHEIMGRFDRGGLEYEWINAGLQVKEALIGHLLYEDMKYRDYCKATGVRPAAAESGKK